MMLRRVSLNVTNFSEKTYVVWTLFVLPRNYNSKKTVGSVLALRERGETHGTVVYTDTFFYQSARETRKYIISLINFS